MDNYMDKYIFVLYIYINSYKSYLTRGDDMKHIRCVNQTGVYPYILEVCVKTIQHCETSILLNEGIHKRFSYVAPKDAVFLPNNPPSGPIFDYWLHNPQYNHYTLRNGVTYYIINLAPTDIPENENIYCNYLDSINNIRQQGYRIPYDENKVRTYILFKSKLDAMSYATERIIAEGSWGRTSLSPYDFADIHISAHGVEGIISYNQKHSIPMIKEVVYNCDYDHIRNNEKVAKKFNFSEVFLYPNINDMIAYRIL